MLSHVRARITHQSTLVLQASAIAFAASATFFAQETRQPIRDAKGIESCFVHVPDTASRVPGDDRIAIDVRVPATPEPVLLARLPQSKRDYTGLPISVFLVTAPIKGQLTKVQPPVLPIAGDFEPKFLPNETGQFITVQFTRAQLGANVDVVGERTAVADSGERVTAQTRCRISIENARAWR